MIILNEEQQAAFDGICNFIRTGNTVTEWVTLSGKAGTGKTVVLAKVVEAFPDILFTICAVAHKAKEELESRIHSRNIIATTVASLLGMRMDAETGIWSEDPYAESAPILGVQVLIVDEASMLSKEIVDLIMDKKPGNAAVIFAGDEGQIRPIRKWAKLDDLSPVFKGKNFYRLSVRVRQGEGNPILPASDIWWDMTKAKKPTFSNLQKPNRITEHGSIIYTGDLRQVIKYYKEEFLKAKSEQDPYKIKIVTYTNKNRERINQIVRELLFGNLRNEIEPGELMIMTNNYKTPFDGKGYFIHENSFTDLQNSREFAVVEAIPRTVRIQDNLYHYYSIVGTYTIKGEKHFCRLPVLAEESKEAWNNFVSEAFAAAKRIANRTERTAAFMRAWEYKDNTFAPVDYGYCITAHRAQGSTYEISIVNLTDMLNAPTNHQEIASLIYTGMTRASKTAVLVNKSFGYTLEDAKVEDDTDI